MFNSPKSARLINLFICAVIGVIASLAAPGCANKVKSHTASSNVSGDTDSTFTDRRDSKVYKKVLMPDGKVWMVENLNYDTADGKGSWCYENSADSCAKYGRLYNWNTAMAGSLSTTANPGEVQGVCPAGWRLPNRTDWYNLSKTAGDLREPDDGDTIDWKGAGTLLKSATGWNNNGNGSDEFGFSALPGGYRYSDGSFNSAGRDGLWWTSTEEYSGSRYAYSRSMYCNSEYVHEYHSNFKSNGFSVRCVWD